MAAKVIHFKKNGSLAPQKFVADDGGNNISAGLSSPRGAETIFLPFYRHRAAREQYFYRFIVAVQRGNNILAVLSSPRGAETISLPFYRHRAARKRYFCPFIVTARRGNNISAVLSSPRVAGTILLPFYRHRAAREQYFCRFTVIARRGNDIFAVSVLAVLLQTHSRTVLTFAGQLRAFRNVARTARGWRQASCRGENEKQSFEME